MKAIIKGNTKKIDRDEFLYEMAVLRDSFEIEVDIEW